MRAYGGTKNRLGERHGLSKSCHAIYQKWAHARNRCFNKSNKNYKNYGARGITMYPAWIDDAVAFVEDVIAEIGPLPSKKHTLDRIDNDGNYEPGNIRWATHKEQTNNFRRNFHITYKGEKKTLSQWSDITGISGETLGWRYQNGIPLDAVFSTEARLLPRATQFEHHGQSMSLRQWAIKAGIKKQTLVTRLRAGWDFGKAVSNPATRLRSRREDREMKKKENA